MKTLKNVLLINTLSSGATGLGLAAMPGRFAEWFGTTLRTPFVGIGIFLVVFAVMVFMEARRNGTRPGWVRFIILMDGLWVACSALVIVAGIFPISVFGNAMIAVVALWVALMGYLQHAGLKKAMVAN